MNLNPIRTLIMVRMTGLEPARRWHQILSLARLPIPPHPHWHHRIIPDISDYVKSFRLAVEICLYFLASLDNLTPNYYNIVRLFTGGILQ